MPVAVIGRIGVTATVTVEFVGKTPGTGKIAGWPLTEYKKLDGIGLSCQLRSELPSEISYSKSGQSGRGGLAKLNVATERMYISTDEGGSQRPAYAPCVSRHAAMSASATNGPSCETVKVPGVRALAPWGSGISTEYANGCCFEHGGRPGPVGGCDACCSAVR